MMLSLGRRTVVAGCVIASVAVATAVSVAVADPGGYPRNATGDTFGSAADASSPAQEPDLILVVATNGREGYVRRSELNRVNGDGSNFTSPQEALAWQAANKGVSHKVPVYKADGHTRIGDFIVGSGAVRE